MQKAAAPKVSFVSLGCPKALVDSERIITRLRAEGYELARKHDGADLVLVEVLREAERAVREADELVGHDAGEALDVRDAVTGVGDVPDLGQQGQGERAEPGADLDHGVPCRDAGEADDAPDRVRVDDEVLPPLLGRAQAEPRRELADLGLCVVGAPLTDAERRRIDELKLADNVFEAGVADDAHVAALYAGSVALVYPSRYEGFGIQPLEAMACGTVAITSNSSSIPEVVGDAALTFDPEDVDALVEHIGRVATDVELRARLVDAGADRASRVSWDSTADATFEIYRSLVR